MTPETVNTKSSSCGKKTVRTGLLAFILVGSLLPGFAASPTEPTLATEASPTADVRGVGSASRSGERIFAPRAVSLDDGGTVTEYQLVGETVRDALLEQDVVLGEFDIVTPALDTPLSDDVTSILIQRVSENNLVEETVTPYQSVRQDDPTQLEGTETVAQVGVNGISKQIFTIVNDHAGTELSRTPSASTSTAPVDEIIRVGTKKKPAPVVPKVVAPAPKTPATPSTPSVPAAPVAPAAPADPGSARAIGKELSAARGWGDDEFACLDKLWQKESGWNHLAKNKSSSAYGIPQALPGSKMASAGADWQTNPSTQITWGLGYIAGRYGTPCGAYAHSQAKNWY